MRKTIVALAAGLLLVAGCGGDRRSGAPAAVADPPTSAAAVAPGAAAAPGVGAPAAPPASAAPAATDTSGLRAGAEAPAPAPAVDLSAVDALLAEADRAMADAQPAAEDDPSR